MSEPIANGSLVNANLKAYYKLNAGALVTDSSGNGYTLTNNNSVAEADGQDSAFGKAADFGVSDFNKSLSIANNLGITTKVISMSCWVKLNAEIASGAWKFIFHQSAEQDWSIGISYEYNGGTRRLNFVSIQAGIGTTPYYHNITLGTSNWYHLAITCDGATVKAYLNGVYLGSVAARGSGNAVASNFIIGGDGELYPTINNESAAIIDDVAVFNDVLTNAEVLAIYLGDWWTATTNYLTNYRGRKRTHGAVSV